MAGVLPAPIAVFFELEALFNFFLVFAGKIIVALANRAFKFY